MTKPLVEREAELEVLRAALRAAASGQGSVVLISGEAGIGKTSLLRSFTTNASGVARVLTGACDDLMTPRTLGPLQDAAGRTDGPLARAIAGGDRDDVLIAVLDEFADRTQPTVLVIEDVHWADDATLDVLRYLSRRICELPALLLISYRDDEVSAAHPAHRLIGGLVGESVHRLGLPRLSRTGVAQLAGGTLATSAPLFKLTAGNPFFLSEVLAAHDGDAVPLTVVDAVLSRVHRLQPATQSALEQLAVVPTRVELPLARALLGDLTVLAEAERRGVLEVRPEAVAFRHELARRAVEGALPTSERMQLNDRVLTLLLGRQSLDLPRIVHHAVQAGDDPVVVEYAPRAAAQAASAGAHRQEIRFYQQVMSRSQLVEPTTRADILQSLTGSLFTVGRMGEALVAGLAALGIRRQQDDQAAVGEVLYVLAPIYWVTARSNEAITAARESVELLRADGESPRLTVALLYLGLLLTATGELDDLAAVADETVNRARGNGLPDLLAMSQTLHGRARLLLGDMGGIEEMRAGHRDSIATGNHVFAIMGYVLLVQDLWDLGAFQDVARLVEEGLAYARAREIDFYVEHLLAYEARLQELLGDWESAEAGLRTLVGTPSGDEPGSLRYSLPALATLTTRRGTGDADQFMTWCQDFAYRAGGYYDIVPAALAAIESAWLSNQPLKAQDAVDQILRFTGRGLQIRHRGELQRWLRRLGRPAAEFPECPEEFAAGIRGDWRAAAAIWESCGSPYHRALELADSGEVEPTLEALRIFDALGAGPAARIARRRLHDLGVSQVPRGQKPTTRKNPAGLTERQMEILKMLRAGHTNAEIAARLVVSVRTVDHHVSAVLQKLGLTSRRQAAHAAAELGLAEISSVVR